MFLTVVLGLGLSLGACGEGDGPSLDPGAGEETGDGGGDGGGGSYHPGTDDDEKPLVDAILFGEPMVVVPSSAGQALLPAWVDAEYAKRVTDWRFAQAYRCDASAVDVLAPLEIDPEATSLTLGWLSVEKVPMDVGLPSMKIAYGDNDGPSRSIKIVVDKPLTDVVVTGTVIIRQLSREEEAELFAP